MSENTKYEFLKLSKLRTDKGLSKTELAARSKVSVTTVREAEKRNGKKQETLMKIFNALNADDLYNNALKASEYIKAKASA
jgi:transcriptional regulator with XRE-family HTH domain